jgi:hypothetical protein
MGWLIPGFIEFRPQVRTGQVVVLDLIGRILSVRFFLNTTLLTASLWQNLSDPRNSFDPFGPELHLIYFLKKYQINPIRLKSNLIQYDSTRLETK